MGFTRVFKSLFVQTLIGVGLGIAVGLYWPSSPDHVGVAEKLEPLGKAFVNLIKMVIGPVIFCTVTVGIARMSDLKAFGRVGGKALLYFEIVSTVALLIGWAVAELFHPGAGMHYVPNAKDAAAVASYAAKAHDMTFSGFLLSMIPTTVVSAFSEGNLLQVLLVSILTGLACSQLGAFGHKIADTLDSVSKVFFAIINMLVLLAPIGAFGAMAFTVGKYGPATLLNLANLVVIFYATSALFVVVVLGSICALCGFSFFKFFRYIWKEFELVFGAFSSEAALPQLMRKLERLGASKPVVGLVVPAGYSFNLDGTNIYMTLGTLFLAQATDTHLSVIQVVGILLIAMLTSKGASGVSGAGFITLAATLAVIPDFPAGALALLLGVDRFMSHCRALTNFMGNAVGAMVVAAWDKALDRDVLHRELNAGPGLARPADLVPAHDETGPD